MAQTWPGKAPTEIVERRWTVPVDADDGLASFVVVVSGVTKDSQETDGGDAVVVLSAGTGGTTASVTITATTSQGRVLVETFYLPVTASTALLGYTARDACVFALRKIAGTGEDADAAELADALERLNDMLAAWKRQGADVGTILPVVAGTVLNVPDEFHSAIKHNLRLQVHEHYGIALSPLDVVLARTGLALVKNRLLPDDRGASVYY